MKTLFHTQMLIKAALNCLYPTVCALCQKGLLLTEDHICKSCYSTLESTSQHSCYQCAKDLPRWAPSGSKCTHCKNDAWFVDETISLFRYNSSFKTLLHLIKFDDQDWIINNFKRRIKNRLKNSGFETHAPSIVVPVPLDPKRYRERKFNQSEIIANTVSEDFLIKKQSSIIKRKKCLYPQSFLRKNERKVNLKNVFSIHKKASIAGQWVLLVDDVITTGTTINECAKVLKEAGASRVTALSLGRA